MYHLIMVYRDKGKDIVEELDTYTKLQEAINFVLEYWHESEECPDYIIRADDGKTDVIITRDPGKRNIAVVLDVLTLVAKRYQVDYVLNADGEYVSTSIKLLG
jgi:hypothetical protein